MDTTEPERRSGILGVIGVSPWVAVVAVAAASASAVVRFFVPTALWLDEALSVNISSLPLGDIPEALRHDGHPPLYYALLGGWMNLVGDGDQAARALSGIIGLATLPLAFLTGRRIGGPRLGWTVATVVALSPFAFRYGSETRMYSLVMAEVFAGWLLGDALLRAPSWRRWAGATLAVSALLWTHYWSLWLLGGVGLLLVIRLISARRREDSEVARSSLVALSALAAGGVTFLPWLGSFIYQSQHTGTPWAPPFRPATLVVTSLVDFGGGPFSEAQMLMFVLTVLAVLGVFGVATDRFGMALRWDTNPDARRPLMLLAATTGVASVAGAATGIAFAPRYAAVYFPFVMVLVALGLDRFSPGRARDVVVAAFCVTCMVGTFFVWRQDRTQAVVVADAVATLGGSTYVVTCPDQLGPSVERALRGTGDEVVAYPRLDDPRRVDWVDYEQRNDDNDPAAVAESILERAGDRTIAVVFMDGYLTLEGQCESLVEQLAATRSPERTVTAVAEDFYEPMNLIVFRPGAT